jgi:hypothetical protein
MNPVVGKILDWKMVHLLEVCSVLQSASTETATIWILSSPGGTLNKEMQSVPVSSCCERTGSSGREM